jgi:hypothetical protein
LILLRFRQANDTAAKFRALKYEVFFIEAMGDAAALHRNTVTRPERGGETENAEITTY